MTIIILAIVLISLIFAPLGCISLWKKYIYFGDGLAHTSLLTATLSIIFHLSVIYAGLIVALLFATIVFFLKNTSGSNAVISLVSSFMLSLALIISYIYPMQINITNLLVGDILSTSIDDLSVLLIVFIIVILFVLRFYNQIILIIINRDIAQIKGIKVKIIELSFLILLALSVFSTIKIVGTLLVISILLIPPMIARVVSSTPLIMIINTVIINLIINSLGLVTSFYLDIPTTPIITVISTIMYSMVLLTKLILR